MVLSTRNKLLVVISLLGILTIASSQPPFPYTFIYHTAHPHKYRLAAPPPCLNIGENYGDVLTGYENYIACIEEPNNRTINYFPFGLNTDELMELEVPSLETKTYHSTSMWDGYDNHSIANFERVVTVFPNLRKLVMVNHKIDTLSSLEKLEDLKYVGLVATYVEDWSTIINLKEVETLNLACSNITNDDLKYVAQLYTVKTLILDGTGISDLSALSSMTNLQNLLVKVTNIESEEQLDVLKPLGLRWISFLPELSMPYIKETRPNVHPYHAVPSSAIEMTANSIYLDTGYPAKDCSINVKTRIW